MTTTDKTIPRYKLSSGGSSYAVAWMEYAMKQRIAPNQRRRAKPPNKFWQNLTHSGVVGGGVKALRPYFFCPSSAAALVRPLSRLVSKRLQSSSTSTRWTSNSSSCLSSFRFFARRENNNFSLNIH